MPPHMPPPLLPFAAFRDAVLSALRAAQRPDTRVLLLYDPTAGDCLGWLDDTRRTTTLLRHAAGPGIPAPRLIELDCRRVAFYLLETDAALDDPWLEASITYAYRYVAAGAQPLPDDPRRAFCGWLVSADSGPQVAQRLADASRHLARSSTGRWHDPRTVAHVWDSLSPAQRTLLLGRMTWLAFDAAGRLRTFRSEARETSASTPQMPAPTLASLALSPAQRANAARAGQVNHLLAAWGRQRTTPLPDDACARLHRRLDHPLARGLASTDQTVFVLATIELDDRFAEDARWPAAVGRAAASGGTLNDELRGLPPECFSRFGTA